jgi:hypothetical protein
LFAEPLWFPLKMSERLPETLSERASRQAIAALSIGHFSTDFWQGCFSAEYRSFGRGTGIFLHNGRNPGFSVQPGNLASSVIQPVFGPIADKRSTQWLINGVRLIDRLAIASLNGSRRITVSQPAHRNNGASKLAADVGFC